MDLMRRLGEDSIIEIQNDDEYHRETSWWAKNGVVSSA